MDEVVRLLMGPIADEVRSNQEPIFGSGRVIGACTQREMDLAGDESEMISKDAHEEALSQAMRERDIAVAQKDKVIKELQEKMKKQLQEKEKEITELKSGRKGGKEGGGTRKLEKTASAKKVDADMKNMLAMMGR
jgi:hypothetical protein